MVGYVWCSTVIRGTGYVDGRFIAHSLLLVEACHLSLPAVRESSQQIASSRVCSATRTVYWTYTSSIVHTRREACAI